MMASFVDQRSEAILSEIFCFTGVAPEGVMKPPSRSPFEAMPSERAEIVGIAIYPGSEGHRSLTDVWEVIGCQGIAMTERLKLN